MHTDCQGDKLELWLRISGDLSENLWIHRHLRVNLLTQDCTLLSLRRNEGKNRKKGSLLEPK